MLLYEKLFKYLSSQLSYTLSFHIHVELLDCSLET